MARRDSTVEVSSQLSEFSDFLPLSFLSTAVIPSIAQVTSTTDGNHKPQPQPQRPSALSVSTSLKANHSHSVVNNESSSTCAPVVIPPKIPTVVVTSPTAVEETNDDDNNPPPPDPKTFEILFVYDDPTHPHAFSCRPSFYTTNQELFLSDSDSVSSEDIFISGVEWRIREKSKQHFLMVTFSVVGRQECRVFILAEGFVPEEEYGIGMKEGVVLLSEFGRSLKRVDRVSESGKGNEVELVNVGNNVGNSRSKRREVHSSKQPPPPPHRFIRKITLSPSSFNLLQLAILVDVAARYRPQYNDLPSLSLWLTTIIYCIIKQKQPLKNMLEAMVDGNGRLLRDFKCYGYESSLMKPHSKKQLPYYLRKFDKAMVKFMDERERRENNVKSFC